MASSSTSLIPDASSSSTRPWKHDVFLSFPGEDTRHNFTSHLHAALTRYGINTFIDDRLKRGESISSELLQAIEESRCSIIVFSEHYASSSWCLDELSKIIECQKSRGHKVFPVFYNVDPSHVRNQRGSYGEALTVAPGFSGWDSRGRYENEVVEQIASKIFDRVIEAFPSNVKYHVGMASRAKALLSLLSIGSADVRLIGVWGMGGVGKTTIAKVVYKKICSQFEAHCFVSNIREKSEKNKDIQKEVLTAILGEINLNLRFFNGGINLIEKTLCSKKVLIVLDDINHIKQLKALAGDHEWFGPGSRVIITTRDKHLLNDEKWHKIFEVEKLNKDEAFQLFCLHAFKQESPPQHFEKLCNMVVDYTKGLPLALEILGCFLYKRSIEEWESELEKLRRFPLVDVQDVLKISYDGLDESQKEVFLDIACFFNGENEDDVKEILRSCDFYPDININILLERSLLTIDKYDKELRMHDLIQEMGREIIWKQSIDPGRRNRLWMKEDIKHILATNSGTESVEGIVLHLDYCEELHFNVDVFKKMNKLRVLKIIVAVPSCVIEPKCKFQVIGDLKYLPNKLRSLHWDGYPFKSLPLNFDPRMLIELNVKCGGLKTVWDGNKSFPRLKFIDLSRSSHLIKTPDFSGAPELSRIVLEGCSRLFKVHRSIGTLKKLGLLNLKGCSKLKKLPESICELSSLQNLDISGCSKLKKLPNDIGSLQGLVKLKGDGSGVEELPASFALLTKLERLSLARCKGGESKSRSTLALFRGLPPREGLRLSCLSGLCSLKRLNLSECNLMEGALPNDLGSLSSLRELDLSGNRLIITLPTTLSQLPHLNWLTLDDCKSLRSLTELPPSMVELSANNCTSLETVSYPSSITRAYEAGIGGQRFKFQFYGCLRLMESDILESTLSRIRVAPSIPWRWRRWFSAVVPGSEIPEWFTQQSEGNSVTVKLTPDYNNLELGLAFCVVVGGGVKAGHIWLGCRSIYGLCHRRINYLQLYFCQWFTDPCLWKKCGLRLVYDPCLREEEEEEITTIQKLEAIQLQYERVPSISCPPSSLLDIPNEAWSSPVLLMGEFIDRRFSCVAIVKFIYGDPST